MNGYFRWLKGQQMLRLVLTLTFAASISAGARGLGQTVTLSVSNAPLEKVCKEIEKQTGYFFVYAKDMNRGNFRISMELHATTLDLALQKLFAGLPFSYQIIDKAIVINTLSKSNSPSNMLIFSDGGKIQGIVLSDQGQPLSGASVTVKSTGKSTLTDFKGEFSFINIAENSILLVSYIGYSMQQVRVKGSGPIRIQLLLAVNELDAMVIKGYYNTSNRLNTGNVSVVKGEDIARQPVTDPLLALEGRVPGLYIQQSSGVPGAYSNLQLRGQNSLLGGTPITSNDPLYILDGTPISSSSLTSSYIGGGILGSPSDGSVPGSSRYGLSPFNNLNPADIESIEVLKDADATAIYGARGGNGVILITTKKGRSGQTKVDLNVYNGAGKVTRKLDLLNLKEYLQMRHEAFANDGIRPGPNDFDINGTWDSTRSTDWQHVLIGNSARFTNAQGSISGGNANTQFSLGGGYSKQATVFPGEYSDQKTSLNIHLNHNYHRLSADFSGSYMNDDNNVPSINIANKVILPPDAPAIYDANGNLNWQIKDGAATWDNPLAYSASRSKSLTKSLIGTLSISYQLAAGLDLRTRLGYTYAQMNQNNVKPSTASPPPYNNAASRSNSFAESGNKSWIIEPQLNYSRIIGGGQLNMLIGSSFQNNSSSSFAFSATSFTSDALIDNPAAGSTISFLGNNSNIYRYSSLFSRINYSWADKYIGNLTLRRDGSSRFGPKRKFGNFGALGVAWIFSKEQWAMKHLPFLSFGKLRGSYGITGNDQIADYQYISTYSPSYFNYQGIGGLNPDNIGNPYFQWERVKKIEGGLELGFLKERVHLNFSYYRNRTDNQLVFYTLPILTGFGGVQTNLPALIQNSGFELFVNSINLKTSNFSWSSTINLSIPKSVLVAFPNIAGSAYSSIYSVGRALSVRYLYNNTGVDPLTGIYKFSAKSGSEIPAFNIDNHWTRPVTQIYSGGIQNAFTYKCFQLDVFVQFVKKFGYNYLKSFNNVPGTANNQLKVVLNRWQKPGDQSSIQKFSSSEADLTAYLRYISSLLSSNAIISNASYLRLQNLAFSYQLPTSWQKKTGLQKARIYLQCQNLFTIASFLGMDPETGALNLPPIRMITAGFQVTL